MLPCMFCKRIIEGLCYNIYQPLENDVHPYIDILELFGDVKEHLEEDRCVCHECLFVIRSLIVFRKVMLDNLKAQDYDRSEIPVIEAFKIFKEQIQTEEVYKDNGDGNDLMDIIIDDLNDDHVDELVVPLYEESYYDNSDYYSRGAPTPNSREIQDVLKKKRRKKRGRQQWTHRKGASRSRRTNSQASSFSRRSRGSTMPRSVASTRSFSRATSISSEISLRLKYDENDELLTVGTRYIKRIESELKEASMKQKEASIKEKGVTYPCALKKCSQRYENIDQLSEHIVSDHDMDESSWNLTDYLEKLKKFEKGAGKMPNKWKERYKYPCLVNKCFKNYDTFKALAEHKRKGHNMLAKYWCSECYHMKFISQEDLNFHNNEKHSIITYCRYCSKPASNTEELHEHLNKHNYFSFPCKYCDKSFLDYNTMKEHSKIHDNDKDKVRIRRTKRDTIIECFNTYVEDYPFYDYEESMEFTRERPQPGIIFHDDYPDYITAEEYDDFMRSRFSERTECDDSIDDCIALSIVGEAQNKNREIETVENSTINHVLEQVQDPGMPENVAIPEVDEAQILPNDQVEIVVVDINDDDDIDKQVPETMIEIEGTTSLSEKLGQIMVQNIILGDIGGSSSSGIIEKENQVEIMDVECNNKVSECLPVDKLTSETETKANTIDILDISEATPQSDAPKEADIDIAEKETKFDVKMPQEITLASKKSKRGQNLHKDEEIPSPPIELIDVKEVQEAFASITASKTTKAVKSSSQADIIDIEEKVFEEVNIPTGKDKTKCRKSISKTTNCEQPKQFSLQSEISIGDKSDEFVPFGKKKSDKKSRKPKTLIAEELFDAFVKSQNMEAFQVKEQKSSPVKVIEKIAEPISVNMQEIIQPEDKLLEERTKKYHLKASSVILDINPIVENIIKGNKFLFNKDGNEQGRVLIERAPYTVCIDDVGLQPRVEDLRNEFLTVQEKVVDPTNNISVEKLNHEADSMTKDLLPQTEAIVRKQTNRKVKRNKESFLIEKKKDKQGVVEIETSNEMVVGRKRKQKIIDEAQFQPSTSKTVSSSVSIVDRLSPNVEKLEREKYGSRARGKRNLKLPDLMQEKIDDAPVFQNEPPAENQPVQEPVIEVFGVDVLHSSAQTVKPPVSNRKKIMRGAPKKLEQVPEPEPTKKRRMLDSDSKGQSKFQKEKSTEVSQVVKKRLGMTNNVKTVSMADSIVHLSGTALFTKSAMETLKRRRKSASKQDSCN